MKHNENRNTKAKKKKEIQDKFFQLNLVVMRNVSLLSCKIISEAISRNIQKFGNSPTWHY